MDKKINIMLEEYGYILNKLKHKVKVIEHITKLSFLTCNNAPYLIVYYIEKKHDIVQLYEKLNEENDQLCSLFWIIGTDISEVYSKNLKTNQYNTLRNMIAYSDLKEVNVKNIEEIKSNQFENIFFEAHCFLRDIDGLHPDEALDELCKLIYAKLYDEEIEEGYFNSKCGNNEEYSCIIKKLYNDANEYDIRVYSLKIPGYKRSRGVFDEPIFLSANAIYKVGQLFAKFNFSKADLDFKARAFQNVYKPATRAGMGQYFTPLQVIRFIVRCISPKLTDLVIDPFAGSAHFLTETLNYVVPNASSEKIKNEFIFYKLHGIEKSERMVRIAMTDMRLHGDGHSNIRCTDSLLPFSSYTDLSEGSFDVVMTNPPFGSNLQKESYSYLGEFDLLNVKNKVPLEVLGLERAVQLLGEGGKIGIVLPESILVNKSYIYVREWIKKNLKVRGIISLPLATFTPFGANIKTSVLIASKYKDAKDYKIFTGVIENIGFDNKGNEMEGPDWENVAEKFDEFITKEGW